MDPRLEEERHAEDVGAQHHPLQEDRHPHRLAATSNYTTGGPLHIAALLGHADSAREILSRNPGFAQEVNAQGFSALHLAAAKGHLPVVRELLEMIGTELCHVRDKEGLVATHTAAMKGRIDVLEELINASPETLRILTSRGDSILHLVVKANRFQALICLQDRLDDGDELWNLRDARGNTILHLAVARKQHQIIQFLLGKQDIDVNAVNLKGSTPLDVLLESPSKHGDLVLGEMIRAVGGKTRRENETELLEDDESVQTENAITPPREETNLRSRLSGGRPNSRLSKVNKGPNLKPKANEYNPDTLMMVAALIATITFQAGLNPPGGFVQGDSSSKTQKYETNPNPGMTEHYTMPPSSGMTNPVSHKDPGSAVLGSSLTAFMVFDMFGLFASLSIIMLLICILPRKSKKLMRILVWILWFAVFSTAISFYAALNLTLPNEELLFAIYLGAWFWVLRIFLLWICVRFIIYLLQKVGLWKKKRGITESNVPRRRACLLLKRTGVVVVVVGILIVCYMIVSTDPLPGGTPLPPVY